MLDTLENLILCHCILSVPTNKYIKMFGKIFFITCCPLLIHYYCKMIIELDNSKDILKNGC